MFQILTKVLGSCIIYCSLKTQEEEKGMRDLSKDIIAQTKISILTQEIIGGGHLGIACAAFSIFRVVLREWYSSRKRWRPCLVGDDKKDGENFLHFVVKEAIRKKWVLDPSFFRDKDERIFYRFMLYEVIELFLGDSPIFFVLFCLTSKSHLSKYPFLSSNREAASMWISATLEVAYNYGEEDRFKGLIPLDLFTIL